MSVCGVKMHHSGTIIFPRGLKWRHEGPRCHSQGSRYYPHRLHLPSEGPMSLSQVPVPVTLLVDNSVSLKDPDDPLSDPCSPFVNSRDCLKDTVDPLSYPWSPLFIGPRWPSQWPIKSPHNSSDFLKDPDSPETPVCRLYCSSEGSHIPLSISRIQDLIHNIHMYSILERVTVWRTNVFVILYEQSLISIWKNPLS